MTQYYINDKEVYDALESTKQKITNNALLEILKNRGVILSSRTEREDLVEALSEFDFMYHEIENLSSKIETSPRRARYKTTEIHNVEGATEEDIRAVLEEIKKTRRPEYNERFKVSKDNKTYKLNVEYTETDLSKTTLKQKQENSAEIFIEKIGNTLVIQSPIKDRAKEITERLKKQFKNKFEDSEPFEISLIDITDAKLRTQFFINILSETESLTYHTVTSVGVESRIYIPGQDEEISTYSITDGNETEDSNEIASSELQELVKASLSGTKILTTSEYKNLIENGFFISHIIWECSDWEGRYRLRVGFENPAKASGFNYDVLSMHKRNGPSEFLKTRVKLSNTKRRQIFETIQHAAKESYKKVREESQK
jgi:hypothetical protein